MVAGNEGEVVALNSQLEEPRLVPPGDCGGRFEVKMGHEVFSRTLSGKLTGVLLQVFAIQDVEAWQ